MAILKFHKTALGAARRAGVPSAKPSFRPVALRRSLSRGPSLQEGGDVIVELLDDEGRSKVRVTLPGAGPVFGIRTFGRFRTFRGTGAGLAELLDDAFSPSSSVERIIRWPQAPEANSAEAGLDKLRADLAREGLLNEPASAKTDPIYRGQKLLVSWTKDGTLFSAKSLGDAWGMTRQALAARVQAGKLFSVMVGGKTWYATFLGNLRAEHVEEVCEAFGSVDGVEHLLYWLRQHGSLKGKTVAQALEDPNLGLAAVTRLATGLARERAV
jgi:hypothetical protein